MPFIGDYYLRQPHLPPLRPTHFREYWTASNGVFVRAQREGISAIIPVATMRIPIDGLFPVYPTVELACSPVGREVVETFLRESWAARDPHSGALQEILFYLYWREGQWYWEKPDQDQAYASVTPRDPYAGKKSAPLLDLHSHHVMSPFFSRTDCADDYGFRLNAVWGYLDTWPTILVRLGIYGHYYPIQAARVFDLPPYVRDGALEANKSANGEEVRLI